MHTTKIHDKIYEKIMKKKGKEKIEFKRSEYILEVIKVQVCMKI